jgi:hypothetical protein
MEFRTSHEPYLVRGKVQMKSKAQMTKFIKKEKFEIYTIWH